MKKSIIAAAGLAILGLSMRIVPASAEPTSFAVTIPLYFGGGHRTAEAIRLPTADDIRRERRLRLARYAFQLADAIVSAIGYRAYSRCLSCLAYPGGGPLGGAPMSVTNLNGNRPAEVDPLIQPFSRGGFASLAIGTLAYDMIDTRIEKHWSTQRREAADIAEIGAHAWGISSWLPEIRNIHRDTKIAAACGAQWQAKRYGEAFSDGCVNAYYRPGGAPAAPLTSRDVIVVCAPARFTDGTYLFSAPGAYVVASGVPCSHVSSPFPK